MTGYSYSVNKIPFPTHLSGNAKGWQAIEVDEKLIAFAAQAYTASSGIINGDTITYPNAWNNVDLSYRVLSNGIKEELLLKSRPVVDDFYFVLKPDGLKPITNGRGIDFVDNSGNTIIRVPGPFMHDSTGNMTDAIEAN